MSQDIELAELIVTKLCHDLSGPVGAIGNGVEFLKDNNEAMRDRSIELIEISASEAVGRIMFLRQAYGVPNNNIESNIENIKKITEDYLKQKKVALNWEGKFSANKKNMSNIGYLGKLTLNMIIVCASSLIYGGTINVKISGSSANPIIMVEGVGEQIKVDPEIEIVLTKNYSKEYMDLKNSYLVYTCFILRKIKMKLDIVTTDSLIRLEAK